jgi:alpha-D-ribose 1-methylphosphonate 5-triphosphate diphosphatase
MSSLFIKNARIIEPKNVIERGHLRIKEGKIEDFGDLLADENEHIIDAKGSILMPGIIDIHTDALDGEIIPRPGADFPIEIAFRELERKMSGCGFTTVYHSMHLGYRSAEYNSRSKYKRSEVFETIHNASKGNTLINNKIHLRFELTGVEAYQECLEYIEKGFIQMLSIMDHTPGRGQHTIEWFMKMVMANGKTEEQGLEELNERLNRPLIDGDELKKMINLAKEKGLAVASHDDHTIEKVDYMIKMGVDICEFPITMEVAKYATSLGQYVIGGASNILRGGSLTGNLNMTDAVLEGAIDSLCSDYYPSAIIHSIFKLHQKHGLGLSEAVNLATLNPAKAVGIDSDTGSIEKGKDADLILVKLIDDLPMVTHTIVKGKIVVQIPQEITYNELSCA